MAERTGRYIDNKSAVAVFLTEPEDTQSHGNKVAILIAAREWIIDDKVCKVTGPPIVR